MTCQPQRRAGPARMGVLMCDDVQDSLSADVPNDETIDEIRERYRGEWIIVRVTQPNPHGEPLRGCVLDHGRYRRTIQQTVMKETEYAMRNHTQFYVFYGHEIVPRGSDWK